MQMQTNMERDWQEGEAGFIQFGGLQRTQQSRREGTCSQQTKTNRQTLWLDAPATRIRSGDRPCQTRSRPLRVQMMKKSYHHCAP